MTTNPRRWKEADVTRADHGTARERQQRQANSARPPGQVVLVLQGGGALGAYQVGVYEALHEAGIEPDWVIGTSIGAINAALIARQRAGEPAGRGCNDVLGTRSSSRARRRARSIWLGLSQPARHNLNTVTRGIPSFFTPNLAALRGTQAPRSASRRRRTTAPRRCARRSRELVDFEYLCDCKTRLTVGAVNARSGEMRYFDSRDETLGVEHVMASGALPPAFGAVRIDGEPYWDGGIYSNTPIEAVLDDKPRRDSLIFAVNVWHQTAAGAGVDLAGDGAHRRTSSTRAAPTATSRARSRSTACATSSASCTKQLPAQPQNDDDGQGARVVGLRHDDARRPPARAARSTARTTPRTSTSRRPASAPRREAGYADTMRMIERAPWQAPRRSDRRRDRARLRPSRIRHARPPMADRRCPASRSSSPRSAPASMGYAIQRGATCTVAAVDEIVAQAQGRRLLACWRPRCGSPAARSSPAAAPAAGMPAGYAVSGLDCDRRRAARPRRLFNGACVFGAIARFGSGDWAYLVTPLGFYLGCLSVGALFGAPMPHAARRIARVAGVGVRRAAVRRASPCGASSGRGSARGGGPTGWHEAIAARIWSPHAATTRDRHHLRRHARCSSAAGPTPTCSPSSRAAWRPASARARCSRSPARRRGRSAAGPPASSAAHAVASAAAALLRRRRADGLGQPALPGGNDGLILVGMPLAWPYAWLAFATMCVTIAIAQLAGARLGSARGGDLGAGRRPRTVDYQREPRPSRPCRELS